MLGLHLFGVIGLAMMLVGAAMAMAPRPTALALRLLGMRQGPSHAVRRPAAWLLVMLGLAIVVLARAVR